MLLLAPQNFPDYQLIDCGDFEKMERFGKYITIRPEPQAVWPKKISNVDWEKMAHVKFFPKTSSSGEWKKLKEMPDRWNLRYKLVGSKNDLEFRLALTSFKHVGVFPEQAVNWDYIYDSIKSFSSPYGTSERGSAKVVGIHSFGASLPARQAGEAQKVGAIRFLNLFAYTGGASLAAKAAGADVTHLDSIKQVVTWARENQDQSGLSNIRWLVEDALKYVKREVKRGNKYHGIILDPPAYGNGPEGEKWKLEDNIQEMIRNVLQLLDEKNNFLILNAYSLGFSPLIIENLLKDFAKDKLETGELYLQSKTNLKLPLGVFGRFRSF